MELTGDIRLGQALTHAERLNTPQADLKRIILLNVTVGQTLNGCDAVILLDRLTSGDDFSLQLAIASIRYPHRECYLTRSGDTLGKVALILRDGIPVGVPTLSVRHGKTHLDIICKLIIIVAELAEVKN